MHKVYRKSKQTMIWLGPADAAARMTIQYARNLDEQKYLTECQSSFGEAGPRNNKSHILDLLEKHPQKETLINSGAELLLRPWFTRVWTEQEAALSSKPVVVCGEEEISWNHIFALAWLFLPRYTMAWPEWFLPDHDKGYADLEPSLIFAFGVERYRLRQIAEANGKDTYVLSLPDALYGATQLGCFDPRDKIYAISSITSNVDDLAPKPDYVTPWQDVYTDLAVKMAMGGQWKGGYFEVLNWSGVCQQGQHSGLPSWVVDWRFNISIQYIGHGQWCAGGKGFRPTAKAIPKKKQRYLTKILQAANQPRTSLRYTLQVTLVMQDTVTYLSGVTPNWELQEILDLDSNSQSFINNLPHSTYITSESVLQAYNTTLIANTTDKDILASTSYVADGVIEWRAWLSLGVGGKDHKMPIYHDAVDNMDIFRYKQFCVSKLGYFCLVPAITEATDIIAIVKGLDIAIVLRQVGEHYIYLGQSYVHGMMELQAGTLAEEFRIRYNNKEQAVVIGRPDGDVRRNGLKMDAGEYVRILGSLGERTVELI